MVDKANNILWHSLSPEETLTQLDVTSNGLADEEVLSRREQFGYNEIPEEGKVSLLYLFLKQFKSLLVLILVLAALISYFTGHTIDMYVILVVVLINTSIGFSQEIRAEKSIKALRRMLVHKARVIRNGKEIIISSKELVPGDILIVEEGDNISADARIINAKNLRTVESSLTGESVPQGKITSLLPEDTVLSDRKNMLFKGTFVVAGFAHAVVCETALNTAIGDIADTLSGIKTEKTNFQRKTDALAKQMGIIAISSAILLFMVAWLAHSYSNDELLHIAIAALVSAIPEGLPAVLSVVLAIGSYRMAKRNAIVREFTSVETLGAVTAILTDKTGTLTQNTLTVKKIVVPDEDAIDVSGEGWFPVGNFYRQNKIIDGELSGQLKKLFDIAGICNNSSIQHDIETGKYELAGDPTEGALLVLAHKGGSFSSEKSEVLKLDDLPFSSKQKFRATLYQSSESREILVVGAPERILELSVDYLGESGHEQMNEAVKKQVQHQIDEWSGNAMRVIGLAYKKVPETTKQLTEEDVTELVFVGIVGMIDPPRPDVKDAVEKCKKAGIRVIMATGDHINTALAIAEATSIIESTNSGGTMALTEQQLLQLDEKEFDEAISKINVFARLSPNMKLQIATRLQAMGHLIAMTGDGVNDAPALKKADVGVAMGIMGTDVARNSAKVILADDNFSTIVNAVEEGRIVFTNTRQTSFFLVTTNFSEILILIVVIALGFPIPLTATQILWLNLVTDGIGDVALATEQGHGDELDEKPISQKENILNKSVIPFLIIMGVVMTTLSITVFFWFLPDGIEKARTTVFVAMACSQLFNLFNMRSLKKSVFEIGPFSNRYINIALIFSFVVQIIIIEVPFFADIFHFEPLSSVEFIVLISLSSSILWVGELYKWLRSLGAKSRSEIIDLKR